MNTTILILTIAGVAGIRFLKGIFNRKSQTSAIEEISGFAVQSAMAIVLTLILQLVVHAF
jgi:uncharacterized membrane protein SpoIIM required for sporulation